MNFNDKFSLYFFDPTKDEEKYSQHFRKVSGEKIVSYSPLYMLRRHILFLSGRLPENALYRPYFSAIILSSIAINSLIEVLYSTDKPNQSEINDFYQKYLGKNQSQVLGLKILRNTLVHSNFMLQSTLNKKGYYFRLLLNELINSNEITAVDSQEMDYLKISFSLHDDLNGNIVMPPKAEHIYRTNKYALIRYDIAPFDYLSRFDQMFELIADDILNDPSQTSNFDSSVTIDNWMKVYSNG